MKVRRPARFFNSDVFPDELELEIVRPPGFEQLTQEEFATLLRGRIADVEDRAAAVRAEKGTSLLGRKTVLRQSFYDRPESFEARRGINPRVAGKSKWARVEALQRLEKWLDAYRIAWLRFASGIHGAIFSAGTYAMRLVAGACCVPLPDTA